MTLLRPALDSVQQLTNALNATRSLSQILRLIRENGRQSIGCDGIVVMLRDGDGFDASATLGLDQATTCSDHLRSLAKQAVIERRTLVEYEPNLTSAGRNCLVIAADRFGVLVAYWEATQGVSSTQVATVELLAGALADAIGNARLIDCLPHLLFTVHADGKVEPLSRLWSEYGLDHDHGALDAERFGDMLHPDDRETVLKRWHRAIARRQPIEIEHRLRHRDGSYRWFRTLAGPMGLEDGPEGGTGPSFVGTSTEVDALVSARIEEQTRREEVERRLADEITDRDRTEARLAKAERIEAVGQLTSGVAHDFNNLLTVIIGNIEFLEAATRNGEGLDERALGRLAAMREAAERGGKLTRQLLAFARRQRLEPRPTDLNDTVGELRGLLPAAIGGGVVVQTMLQDGLWPAFVDRTQIERMILNLALNAHDAMEVGGTITIGTCNRAISEAEAETLGLTAAGDFVETSVGDTGRGMEPSVLARAFEPFFTTKPPGKGSGLGLAQVYGFARQSGGIVTLRSTPGEGTMAAILLPRATMPAALAPASWIDNRPQSPSFAIPPVPDIPATMDTKPNRLVLLVDDDHAVRDVTSSIVAEAGYHVVEAASGQEAMERLGKLPQIDLMVTDYAMPGMNGHELLQAARQQQPGLKVLFVTGYADLTALADVPERRILLKPFRGAALLDKIAKALIDQPETVEG